jgi:hypothetical protein
MVIVEMFTAPIAPDLREVAVSSCTSSLKRFDVTALPHFDVCTVSYSNLNVITTFYRMLKRFLTEHRLRDYYIIAH